MRAATASLGIAAVLGTGALVVPAAQAHLRHARCAAHLSGTPAVRSTPHDARQPQQGRRRTCEAARRARLFASPDPERANPGARAARDARPCGRATGRCPSTGRGRAGKAGSCSEAARGCDQTGPPGSRLGSGRRAVSEGTAHLRSGAGLHRRPRQYGSVWLSGARRGPATPLRPEPRSCDASRDLRPGGACLRGDSRATRASGSERPVLLPRPERDIGQPRRRRGLLRR